MPVLRLVVILVALVDRIWRLEFQSLWWDEGVSIYLSGASLGALTLNKDFSVDLHPPGYYLALALWRDALGASVFSGRLLSVFGGVLTVALTYTFTRMVCRDITQRPDRAETSSGSKTPVQSVGMSAAPVVAAVLAAISPIDVFYSQETRMYPFLPVLGLLSLIATIRLARNRGWRAWVPWVLVNLASWYVYYYLALLTVAESLSLLLVVLGLIAVKRQRITSAAWFGANLALAVGYLPWLAIVGRRAMGSSLALPPETETHLSPYGFLLEIARGFTLGFTSPPSGDLLLVVWLVLASAGVLLVYRRNGFVAGVLILSIAIPIAGAGAILLERPFFYPRFILFVLSPVWALTAIGLTSVSPLWLVRGALLVPLVAGSGFTWLAERTTTRTAYSTADYRAVFDSMLPLVKPVDVILGGYPWEVGYAQAYFWRTSPRASFVKPGAEASTVYRSGDRLWVFTYDPAHQFVGDTLDDAAAKGRATYAVDQNGDSRLRLFDRQPGFASETDPGARTFDGQIALASALVTVPIAPRAGDAVNVVLRWQALNRLGSDDTVFVHLVGPDGKIWGQIDAPPLGGAFPTSTWSGGEIVVDRRTVRIAAGAPPGPYHVEVGWYQPADGRRLTVGPRPEPDNRVIVGTFAIEGEL